MHDVSLRNSDNQNLRISKNTTTCPKAKLVRRAKESWDKQLELEMGLDKLTLSSVGLAWVQLQRQGGMSRLD